MQCLHRPLRQQAGSYKGNRIHRHVGAGMQSRSPAFGAGMQSRSPAFGAGMQSRSPAFGL
jgi:hypothetical protein